jgi:hypothetical protein
MNAGLRDAVERDLASRGLKLVTLKRAWFYLPALFSMSLSSLAAIYRALAINTAGDTVRLTYAHDPIGWSVFERAGLKRKAGRAWVDIL